MMTPIAPAVRTWVTRLRGHRLLHHAGVAVAITATLLAVTSSRIW
jgi:hypothetical protein